MSYVTTNDNVSLFVKDWGQGRPVVMLHGWPLTSDTFDDLALAVADAGMRAIAYDRRGFGRSDQPWSGYDYDTLADDLAAVMEQTGAEDATLIGFSMGGGEVARYMSRHAGRGVSQAVLIASVVPYLLHGPSNLGGVPASVFETMHDAIRQDRAAFWATFFKQFYGTGLITGPVSESVLEWSRAMAMQASLKATLECAVSFATTDFRSDLAAFAVPTLVIHGSGDQTVPIEPTGRQAAAGIRGARLIEYDGAPHGLLASHKERLTSDLLPFLQSSRSPS